MNRLQNSNLPFINLSKENLFLVCDMLELDEIGTLMVAIKEYIYEGKEPILNTKALKSAWNQVIMLMDRKADSYFTRKEQMEKINKNKKEKKVEDANISVTGYTADSKPSNDIVEVQPQQEEKKPTEAIKTTIEDITPNEFVPDEEKYGNDVMDLIDENPEIINALKSVVEYRCGDKSKLMEAQGANTKINRIVKDTNTDANFISRVEKFCADYMSEYSIYVLNNKNVEQAV